MNAPTSFPELIAKWPSLAALSRDLNVPYPTAAAWSQREYIPSDHWSALIPAAKNRGVKLTLETLHSWPRPESRKAMS